MDPRQPQHPFTSRNTTSPYGRTPFPPTSSQPQYPTSSHPPPAAPAYADHQRRPSDPPYYNPTRSYGQEGPPMSGPSHSRHQSSSSVGHGTPVNRGMPPPSSPQQQAPQATHHYGPPPPRPPPVSVGPPSAFPSSRELPGLPSLGRPPSGRDNMSISSMLGGPPPASREPPISQPHYASPVATSAPPSSMFGTAHASPRMTSAGPEYAPFRRPQTPEHTRQYETRDNRANSAGSPPGLGHYGTPEARRFGTPQQSYPPRVAAPEERREPIRVPNPNAIPPRPNSQPSGFNAPPPPRLSENPRPQMHNESVFGGSRRVDPARPDPPRETYSRPAYEERHNLYYDRDRQERERERDMLMQRERDLRDRERERLERERDRERLEHEQREREYAHQMAQRNPQPAYNRPPETREQPWARQSYEAAPPPRPAYDQPPPERVSQQSSNGYYPATTAPQYAAPPAYATNEPRYGPAPQPTAVPIKHEPNPAAQYEASMQERPRYAPQQEQRPMYGAPPPNGAYQSHESPRKVEDPSQMQQQSRYLGVSGINRAGNRSPLPQAVQGAQSQFNAPGGDPAIANEFGKIFGGLGGSGGMGVSSPLNAGPQGLPFSSSGQLRREDLENLQESPLENGQRLSRTASNNGRRRKLKEEGGDDESSTGRRTPSGRGKRLKTHQHGHHRHHHHHHVEPVENTSSPSQSNLTPFKSLKGSNIPSPPSRDQGVTHHHHYVKHQPHAAAPAPPPKPLTPPPRANAVIPLQKVTIRNQAVLDSVADLPRKHLGHAYYHSTLKPDPLAPRRDFTTGRGFASTPQPLPRFEGNENCTFTVKIMRAYLDHKSREEITIRRAVWGTDIYTDDSDIIAACIHQGWFKGAWPAGVDENLLGLELGEEGAVPTFQPPNEIWTQPSPSGPADVPKDRDLNINIIILPLLDKYSSVTRFGIKSREWGGNYDGYHSVHDGLSFMIQSIQWVDGVDGLEGRNFSDRREFLAQQQREDDLEAAKALEELVLNSNGNGKPQFEESFERGGAGPEQRMGEIKGLGMSSWWEKPNGVPKKAKEPSPKATPTAASPPLPAPEVLPSVETAPEPQESRPEEESEPQQEQSRRISRVTELMIANANSSDTTGNPEERRPVTPVRAEIQAPTPSPISPVHRPLDGPLSEGREEKGEGDVDVDMDATL